LLSTKLKSMTHHTHTQAIIDQFSQQAGAYTAITAHSDALDKLLHISQVQADDTVLDVACGSGIVACAFATQASHVTGIDITARMIEEAKKNQQKKGLHNMQWQIGEVATLPYSNESFSIVVSRFGFHHFQDPASVLAEMTRVCKTRGQVLVVDVALPANKVEAYNRMEKLRDPSHTAALTHNQFMDLFKQAGLQPLQFESYHMAIELEEQLHASFPLPGDKERLKEMIMQDAGKDELGVKVQVVDGKFMIHYPVSIFLGRKA
jgi:ubiquinone/menaquinone biosynthesis C-methylase UbiE